jgi:hypothetical protein
VWVARADGSGARRLVRNAFGPNVSPDGRHLAYAVPVRSGRTPITWVRSVAGDTFRLGPGFGEQWAPDGKRLALVTARGLVLVGVRLHARRVLVRGNVCCPSFAPDGSAIAYARGNGRVGRAFRSDVYGVRLADGHVLRLTHDRRSDLPVWGRRWIAYRHYHNSYDWLIGEIRLMRPDGSGKRRFARGHDRPSLAQMGVEPVAFSADGTRLLGCLAAEFECPPVAFTVPVGRRHVLRVRRDERRELAYGAAISGDGSEVLVEVGGLETPHRVVVVPFAGGRPRLLARNATSPSWAR